MTKKTILIGILGSVLDSVSKKEMRWERWRPSIGICQQEELVIGRFHLLYGEKEEALCQEIMDDLAIVSPETEVIPRLIRVKDRWDFEEVFSVLHEFSRSLTFDADQEDWLVHITTGTHVEQICLFLLTESHHFPARLVQTAPPKRSRNPLEYYGGQFQIIDLDLSRYDRLASRFAVEQLESTSLLKSGIATRNEGYNRLINQIEHVAINSKTPILLTGATGVGKTRIASQIYELKRRRQGLSGPLVEVNCATLTGDMAASALFGHIKGAFTGAQSERVGFLRAADNGILFLDEIGELGLGEQATLLRALEEKRFRPVGSDREVHSNFQLIAGTNRDLTANVRNGLFREDLLARINLWTFRLPNLVERREDIAPNIEYELARFTEETGIGLQFHREALEVFLKYAVSSEAEWPANFRDLHSAIFRMGTLASGGRITMEHVMDEIARLRSGLSFSTPKIVVKTDSLLLTEEFNSNINNSDSILLQEIFGTERVATIDRADRVLLAEVIRVCRKTSSLSEAGRILFDVSRQNKKSVNDADRLRKYLARFQLHWDDIKRK